MNTLKSQDIKMNSSICIMNQEIQKARTKTREYLKEKNILMCFLFGLIINLLEKT